jgi:probable phosphoglycerate mutase
VLWRHGQTAWNAELRFQGQTDVDLDATGQEQAERAARMLAALKPAAIVSSDLRRAADTAAALAAVTGLEVTHDRGLRETYAGQWEGLRRPEIKERFGAELAAWSAGEDVRPGGGESRSEVADRATEALERALDRIEDRATLVAVTHGGATRVAIGRLLGMPQTLWGALGPLSNCSWSVLEENRTRWRLLEHNAGSLPEPVLGDER